MEINFIPLDYDYFDFEGKNYIKIFGRDEKGKKICVIDSFSPFFWAILKEDVKPEEISKKIEKIKVDSESRTTKIEKVEVHEKNFLGKKVTALKIFITNYKDSHDIADQIDFKEIECMREYDLNLITKYIIDKKVYPLNWYKVHGEIIDSCSGFWGIAKSLDVANCIQVEKIEKTSECDFSPKILAFDIECEDFEIGKGEIIMISLVGKNFQKVLTWKKSDVKKDYLETFKNEAEMLKEFVANVRNFDPDILVGYFSDGFDLPYLRARAEKNKVGLSLGLDSKNPTFAKGKISSARLSGRAHVDIFRFIETVYSQYLQSETLGLDDVSRELLGEGKTDFDLASSIKSSKRDWEAFFEYNLQDSILTFRLAEKLWPDMQEFARAIQEPLFEITRNSMSQLVESYIIHNLEKYNEIAEKRPHHEEIGERRGREKYEGAFVFQPKPGLYEDVCFFDFSSMYASVIVSYNLSLSSLTSEKKDSFEGVLGDKPVYFSKKPAFFPQMLHELIKKRREHKEQHKKDPNPITKARSNAYKLLANAAYGYQGFFGARYYCIEAASSTAYFARQNIHAVIEKIQKEGFNPVYSDTDSIAFTLGDHTKKQALDLLEKINKNLPGIMELDLEDFYKRGIWVTKRTGEFGAKKKYALINEEGKLKIRGFETVRRDWCDLVRKLQSEVLKDILEQGNEKKAVEHIKETIKRLKAREVNKTDIMIRTQLKKPLNEYKAITPHVIAAKKIQEAGSPIDIGMLIEYYIAETRERKDLVREKVKLPQEKGEYNIQYYLERQVLPAVENIIEVFGVNIRELIDQKKQMKLGEF